MKVTLAQPWLIADLGGRRRVLSFAPHRPGFVFARRIVWRQVRNADLPPDFDAHRWLAGECRAARQARAVAMLTSREIARWHLTSAGPVACLATVGLSNAERIGHRQPPRAHWGTINMAVSIDAGLTDPAMIEAMTIAAQARTAAVIDAGVMLPQGPATGTGTDCIALAAHPGETRFAGLHTELGEAIGRACYDAIAAGAAEWQKEAR